MGGVIGFLVRPTIIPPNNILTPFPITHHNDTIKEYIILEKEKIKFKYIYDTSHIKYYPDSVLVTIMLNNASKLLADTIR